MVVSRWLEAVQTMLSRLSVELGKSALIKQMEARTGVPRTWLFLIASVAVFAIAFLGFGANLLVLVVGTAYPAYASLKSIESTHRVDEMQWYVDAVP